MKNATETDVLEGKTLRIYRFLFKAGQPQGIRDIQRGLGLSSPSVVEYHIKKLLHAGLIEDNGSGYIVDKKMLGNMVRFRRRLIPYQAGYVAFFGTSLVILFDLFRNNIFDLYWFSLAVLAVALGISVLETLRSLRKGL